MNREEYLDYLIEQGLQDGFWPSKAEDDIAANLAAAEALARFNQLEPPPELAARVEARIRARARTQHNGRITALDPHPQARRGARRPLLRRAWVLALSTAAVLLLAVLGVANVAAGSLPGDPLYGLKQFGEQMALARTDNSTDRANLQIAQLQSAIGDLESEVSDGHSDADITQALGIVASETRDSQSAVAALPAGSARDAAAQALADALRTERSMLYRLLGRVDWSVRLAFTQQLGALGAPVPTVTQVDVTDGSDNILTLRLMGTNFASGARLVINGQPQGTVSQNTGTELIAEVSASNWPEGNRAVGVLNPDGTAAQTLLKGDDDHQDGSGGGDDHGGTPSPGSTPGSGGDDGGSGGGSSGGGGGSGSGSGGGSNDGG